jgi:rod shape determining protein RodA
MFADYNFRKFNFRLLIYVLALNVIGILVINSAVDGDRYYIDRQLIGLIGGLMMVFILSLISYHLVLKLSGAVYLGCIGILMAVIIAGQLGGGSKRWITLPVIGRFQPSEFVKIGLILFFSWYLQKNQEKINQPIKLITIGLLASIPLLLILDQPDLSTTIVITFVILCMIFIAGISYKWIFGALIVVIPLAAILIYLAQLGVVPFLKGYQVNRILAFINPGKYAELNLQQDNSKMAIGSGMLYGKGLFNDTAISVKNGNFLSEEHTDFIFSVIGEELGFLGCMIVIGLFALVVFECLLMAQQAEDMAGRLLCTGMAALIGFQAFTNIAVATGIFPNTGLPLPFISYGVSSLVSLYIGIGIILNVGLQQRKHE